MFIARDRLLRREVAVKVFRAKAGNPEELRTQDAEANSAGLVTRKPESVTSSVRGALSVPLGPGTGCSRIARG